jgi:hypothetical protein
MNTASGAVFTTLHILQLAEQARVLDYTRPERLTIDKTLIF